VILTVSFGWLIFKALSLAVFEGSKPLMDTITTRLLSISPTTSLTMIFTTAFEGPLVYHTLSNIVIGLILFGVGWAIFDMFNTCENGAVARPKPKPELKSTAFTEDPSVALSNKVRQGMARPRPGSWAVTWRDFYFYFGGLVRQLLILVVILVTVVLVCIFVSITSNHGMSLGDIASILITLGVCFVSLRLGIGAARIFKLERKGETLSALALLPKSMRRVAYEKVLALLISTLPGVVAFGLGMAIIGEPRIGRWGGGELLAVFVISASVIFGLHLITYLSLFLRWVAFPVAIVICSVLWLLFGLFMLIGGQRGGGSGEEFFVVWGLLCSVSGLLLHLLISKRLIHLAH